MATKEDRKQDKDRDDAAVKLGPERTYKALRRTWLSHESRMVEAGEVFTTAFPLVDAPPELDANNQPIPRRRGEKPEKVEMELGDNIELADDEEVTEPAIGTESGDKKVDRERIDRAMQDHIDRQRASLPSPGLSPGPGEFQRASDGPPTAETDDDKGGKPTAAKNRAEDARKEAEEQRRKAGDPAKDRSQG